MGKLQDSERPREIGMHTTECDFFSSFDIFPREDFEGQCPIIEAVKCASTPLAYEKR